MKKLDLDTIATIRNGLETLEAELLRPPKTKVYGPIHPSLLFHKLLAILDEEEKDLNEELAGKYADFTHAQEE
jgi:hypothetical protein